MSVKSRWICSSYILLLDSMLCNTMSLSFCALSIAAWQNTAVTTLSTAKMMKVRKAIKTTSQARWMASSGCTTLPQSTPPETDWNSVTIDVSSDPQYVANKLAVSSSWRPGMGRTCNSSYATCVKITPATYMMISSNSMAQNNVFIVLHNIWSNVRKAPMISTTRTARTFLMILMTRTMRKLLVSKTRAEDCTSSPLEARRMSRTSSIRAVPTRSKSKQFHAQYSDVKKDNLSEYNRNINSMRKTSP
mmetsp:Transcript_75926/g.232394  ORF Transcript_75926/g.232394 Transcript_75926/m.232394 type:complete len:247 (+) Transcript_75926:316-1056(+)